MHSIRIKTTQKTLVILSRAFCVVLKLSINFINVHLVEKRIQDKQIPVFLK